MDKRIRKYIGIASNLARLDLEDYIKESTYHWIDNNYHYPIDSRVLAQGIWNAYINCDEPYSNNVDRFLKSNL